MKKAHILAASSFLAAAALMPAATLTWNGTDENNVWDTSGTNWRDGTDTGKTFADGDIVSFDDTAASKNVVIGGIGVFVGSIVVNTASTYTFSGDYIYGGGPLQKLGTGTLILSNVNAYTGFTRILGGTIELTGSGPLLAAPGNPSALGSPSSSEGSLILDGGTLRFNGTASTTTTRSFTLGAGGGTLEAASTAARTRVAFTGTYAVGNTGTGDRTLTLTGAGGAEGVWQDNTTSGGVLSLSLLDPQDGQLSVVKNGTGAWVLAGNNYYTGGTTINGGGLGVASDSNFGAVPSEFEARNIVLNGGLIFAAGYGNYSNNPAAYTFGEGVNLTLNANRGVYLDTDGGTFRVWGDRTTTVNGVISGTGALTKTDAGTLVLTAANTYTGGTVINNGWLSVSSDANLGAVPSEFDERNIVFNGGVIYNSNGSAGVNLTLDANRGVYLDTNGGAFHVWDGKTTVVNGVISGTGTLRKTDTGTLVLTAANTYTGGTVISSGTLSIGIGNTSLGDGEISLANNATLSVGGTGAATLANPIYIPDTGTNHILAIGADATLTVEKIYALGASRNFVKKGDGTLILSGNTDNTSTALSLDAGTVILAKNSSLNEGVRAIGSGLTVSGGKLVLAGTGPDIAHPNNTDQIYDNVTVALNGGVFDLNGRSETIATLTSSNSTASGTLTNTAAETTSTLTVGANNANGTFHGVISDGTGAVALAKIGSGAQTLTAANTYTGGTTINGGIVSIGTGGTGSDTASVQALGTGAVTINSGGTLRLWIQNSREFTIANDITVNGGTIHNEDGLHHLTGAIGVGENGATFAIKWNGKYLFIDGPISGNGKVTIAHASGGNTGGAVFFNGTNSYIGETAIGAGATLVITSLANLGTGEVSLSTGSRLVYNGTGAATLTDSIRIYDAGDRYLEIGDDATLTLERLYAGGSDRHVVKGGEGTLILAGAEDNSFAALRVTAGTVVLAKEGTEHNGAKALGSGTLTISGGKLVLAGTGADSAHPYNTDQIYHNVRVVLTGGIFDTNGRSEEISSLSSTSSTASGIVTNSAADTVSKLSVGTNNASGTFYGVIGDGDGTVALAKVGTGTETLTGANTYTGGTTIKLGILQLDFSASGAPAANILAENSALTLGGSSLHIRGGNGTDGLVQSFSKVELTQDATIRLFPDNATRLDVQLGEITTNGHTLALSGTDTTLVEGKAIAGVANFLTTTAAGNNDGTRRLSGVLFNGTAWASTAADAGNTGNYIVPWTASYTNVYARNDTLLDYVTADVRLVNGTGESPTLALKSTEAAIVVNSLLMSATDAAATIATEGKSFSLVSGDLALGAGAQALTIGAVPNDGTLTSGTQLLWVVNASASPLTFNAAITDNTGAVNVLLDGGTSVFAGANTYSGTTTIANGAQLHVNATGAVGTGDIVNNGIFVIRNDDSRTLANKISGGGSFEKYGEGTLAITSDNTFAGAALIGEGAVEISSFAKLGNGLIFFYGGTIRYTGEGEESISRPITVSPEYGTAPSGSVLDIVNPDAVLTLRKVDDFKNNKITKTGPGTLVLGGTAASYGASIVVEEGTLYLAHETTNYIGAVGSSKPGDYGLVLNAGNVIVQGPIVLPRPQESSSTTSQIYFESGVQVNGGVLDLNGRHECIAYLDGTGGVITNTADTLSFFRVGSTASDRSIRNEPSNYAGVITGDIALTKSGNGTFTLSGENTYTGGTTVLTGILRLDFSAENAPQANILAADSALTLDGSGALEIVAGAETNGLVQSFSQTTLIGNSVIRVNRGDAERVDVQLGIITTDGHTLKVFGGDTTLSDSHAVVGAVNFRTTSSAGENDGATRLAGVIFGAEGWASIAFDSGNKTKYLVPLGDAAYTDVVGGTAIPAAPAADVRLSDGTGNIALGAGTTTVNSLIATATTAPTVIETAGKTLVLASGDIALAVGAQELSVGATPADAGSITAGDGTDAASLSVTNVSSASLVLNAAITDNADAVVGVTANGTGKIVLAGVNTYKGETTVESGILLINGDQHAATGAVTVKDGATLGGKGGIIGGVVTVEDGGTLSPGASIGELSFTENVTLSAGAKLILEIDTSGGVPQFDLITFLGADKTLTLAEEGALEISNIGGASIEGSFQIVQNATVLGTLAFSDSRYAYTFGEGGLLTITSVPEPSTYALIGAVGAVALAFIRRRRRPSKTGL